ncbi:hypothetical protein ACFDR9_002888 [Janthinobacterium sp. CG_23.3]|uniref:hypothetical protein n=1 Tax=Janthinobacterium sp. CG_23.3 TaxID=3349634 RepID=UPI0038D4E56D
MKSYRTLFTTLAVSFLFTSPTCHSATAGNQDPDALIARIIKSQLISAISAENLPVIASTLQFVRQTNPNLKETQWNEIIEELNDAIITGMSEPGNPVFAAYKKLLGSFSEAELAKLENLLGDPVYRKYSSALLSPVAQKALMQGFIENSPWMPQVMNFVLRKRGLKEVH